MWAHTLYSCFAWISPLSQTQTTQPIANSSQGLPSQSLGVKTLEGGNVTIRYKSNDGLCETVTGVKSFSGYVDVDEDSHVFFWFFEARENVETAPITVWLNGGPGADSLIGLFEEMGPCHLDSDGKMTSNPYSFNEVSNLLFISQPLGTGFSYQAKVVGEINATTGIPQASMPADGRYASADPYRIDTTSKAASMAWEVVQGFFHHLPSIDPRVQSRTLNLWTESYGGHYGPTFFRYFHEQIALVQEQDGKTILILGSLGIINGLISARIQMPSFPEFAYKNTYGIKGIDEATYNFTKEVLNIPGGCLDSLDWCAKADLSDPHGRVTCVEASAICRKLVEGPYSRLSGLSSFDIRVNKTTKLPSGKWVKWLNTAFVQDALGVDLNYTSWQSTQVLRGFLSSGDYSVPQNFEDLEWLVQRGVRVALIYGDADYICNWFGGEAVSLATNYAHSAAFRNTPYAPLVVDGHEYGQSRQYGNFSFTRVYEAGHEVPFYQPKAALEMFRRTLSGVTIADGSVNSF